MDMALEVVVRPVADADRAKDLYVGLGWRLDADGVFHRAGTGGRPPGPDSKRGSYNSFLP